MEPDVTINKIDRIQLHVVRLPLIRPFTTSFGTETHKETLLIQIRSGDAVGWGECVASPAPHYSYETNEIARLIIKKHLIPLLKTGEPLTLSNLPYRFNRVRGHPMARAAVENALLDLMARQKDTPLFQWIGGNQKKIMSGISIGIRKNPDDLLEAINQALEKKYHRIKIKIKKGRDIGILRIVREAFPGIRLMADANADYAFEDLDDIKKFDAFDLMMIEQPLAHDDLYFHSLLQREINTPICLDESIKNLEHARAAIRMQSGRIINIKQGRVGGLLAARDIQEHCRKNQTPCWSGGMLETGIGRAVNLHLQTLPGFTLPGDTSETARYFHEDIVDQPVVLDKNGFIDLPEGPGIGVEIVPEKLKKFAIFSEKIF